MITHLRNEEEVLLSPAFQEEITKEEKDSVADFLERDHQRECLDYPFVPPDFDRKAALWGAGTVFFAAQLLLNRKSMKDTPENYLIPYEQPPTQERALSVDLCLRFLPDLLQKAREIDIEDEMIGILEEHLKVWHYSAIRASAPLPEIDLAALAESPCMMQLYLDRIIEKQAKNYLKNEELKNLVKANLGGDRAGLFEF